MAFQGERGAYSEEAAVALLGEDVRTVPCATFESLFDAVGDGRADYALAPVENTLAGDVGRALDLLQEHSLFIVGEVSIPVSHNLVGCRGARLDGVRVVESHPVALAQCERFFAERPHIRRIVSDDTAASVRRITESGDVERAAIAGSRAARLYGGVILAGHLEDDPANYTRFLLLAAAACESTGRADKLSLAVLLPHVPGALRRALAPFDARGIELLRVATRPVKGRPWHYRFFLDFKASTADGDVLLALSELGACAAEVRLLGCYPSASTIINQ
ncbi:MAG TPA: prephenate dehydratase domain-containing protein [Pyrinomonadaceae bacterium]